MNKKRMGLSLIIAAIFGIFCAWGTNNFLISSGTLTAGFILPFVITVFYARLLMGLVIGLADNIKILAGKYKNSALRGAILGAIVSIVIAFYGGGEIFVAAGIVYGIIIDLVATSFSK